MEWGSVAGAGVGAIGGALGKLFGNKDGKLRHGHEAQDILWQELLSGLSGWGSPYPMAMLESNPKEQNRILQQFGERFTPQRGEGMGVQASPYATQGYPSGGYGNMPMPAFGTPIGSETGNEALRRGSAVSAFNTLSRPGLRFGYGGGNFGGYTGGYGGPLR